MSIFKELRGLKLKSVADLLPGQIFSLSSDEGYVSYFIDQAEKDSDLAKAFIVFRDALASREPVTIESMCRIIDAYRIIDFLTQKETQFITPALYAELAKKYESFITTSMQLIELTNNFNSNSDELKAEKSRALVEYYKDRLEYCKQQSAGAAVETPSKLAVSDTMPKKPEKRGLGGRISFFGRKPKEEAKPSEPDIKSEPVAPVTDESDITPVVDEPEIPGGFAEIIEEPKEEKPDVIMPKEDDKDEAVTTEDNTVTESIEKPAYYVPEGDDDDEDEDPVVNKVPSEAPVSDEVKPYVPVDDDEDDDEEIETAQSEEISFAEPDKQIAPAIPSAEDAPATLFTEVPVMQEKPSPAMSDAFTAPAAEKEKSSVSPVFTGVFEQKTELSKTELSKTEAGDIPYYEKSLTFTGYLPCKDMKNYALIFVKNAVYFGRMENIHGNAYDNSDESLLELTRVKPQDSFVTLMTEDVSNTDTAFTEEEKKTIRMYFDFVTAVFNENMGKSVTANEYMSFKKYYNRLIDKMLELSEDETILYYKALMYADRYLTYMEAYNIAVTDSDRESVAQSIMDGDVTGITENFGLIKEFHIADDTAKENIDDYIHLIEIFPDNEREEEKLPELPAIYKGGVKTEPEPEELPPGAAMPVYDGGYGGFTMPPYGQSYGQPYGQPYQQPAPATPVQVIVNNNFPGATSSNGTNNQK